MNMSIPKMNKNAVFIKNFTFRLRNISYHTKRGISDSFPKENEVFNRRHRVAACQRQAYLSEKAGRKLSRCYPLLFDRKFPLAEIHLKLCRRQTLTRAKRDLNFAAGES